MFLGKVFICFSHGNVDIQCENFENPNSKYPQTNNTRSCSGQIRPAAIEPIIARGITRLSYENNNTSAQSIRGENAPLILFHMYIIYNFNFSVNKINGSEINNGDAKYLPRRSTGKCSPLFTESEVNRWFIIHQRANLKLEKKIDFFEIIMCQFNISSCKKVTFISHSWQLHLLIVDLLILLVKA